MDSALKPNQVLHVRENSDSELEALFKVLNHKDGPPPGQIPYSMRKLPASFFTPPDQKASHSRESSTDSTSNAQHSNSGFVLHQGSGLTVSHPRAHSSPANLQQSLAVAPPLPSPPQGPHHVRQPSFDLAEDNTPLPHGWEMAKTPDGQRYFLNHLEQLTTWQDPRKSAPTSSPLLPNLANIPMPYGWEQAHTPEGEPYFINHIDKVTSWFDPRIPAHLQRPGVLGNHVRSSSSPITPQQASPQHRSPQHHPPPAHPQHPPHPPPHPSSQAGGGGHGQAMQQGDQQRAFQLQQLQLEKERLRKRQDELARQEMLLRTTIQEENVTTPSSASGDTTMAASTTQSMETNSSFATHNSNNGNNTGTDFHTRQESADSGLGTSECGMGTNFGHSKTPDDFLSNVDEMDTHDSGPIKMGPGHGQSGGQAFVLGPGQVDLNSLANDASNMDGEELVPSLQEDISNELLNDVETVLNSNKMDNLLTWL